MIEYQFKIEKNAENEPKPEIYSKMYDEDSYGKEKSNSAEKFSNVNNLSENLSYEMGPTANKTAHPKIFKTTVIQRKKSVNFKVIKNKERDQGNSNSQNEINHYEKINNNKNNFNNYFIEEQSNSNGERRTSFLACEDSNKEENINFKTISSRGHIGREFNMMPFNEISLINKINYGNNIQSSFSSTPNEINIIKTEFQTANLDKRPGYLSGYQKKVKKETYIDILIKAADRITQLGYFSTENPITSNASIPSLHSEVSMNDEVKFKPASILEYTQDSFINDNKHKMDYEAIEIISNKINSASDSNSNDSMTNNSNQIDCDDSSNGEQNSLTSRHKSKSRLKSSSNSKRLI